MSAFLRMFSARCRPGAAALCLAGILALAGGCTEPVTTYQVAGAGIAGGRKVLVMPFMDTRTFVDSGDPHKDDLGNYARDIFTAALKDSPAMGSARIMTPEMPYPEKSLSNAEVAELGRRHGAEVVVAGQIFSYTDTRAASIPSRAGMFIRVISAEDGALVFVGDHYLAAPVPGTGGGRDAQARTVAARLVGGMAGRIQPLAAARAAASGTALASLIPPPLPPPSGLSGGDIPEPEPPPLITVSGGQTVNPKKWDDQLAPEPPPVLDYNDDFYNLPPPVAEAPKTASPLPEPPPVELTEETTTAEADNTSESEVEVAAEIESASEAEVAAILDAETAEAEPDVAEIGGDTEADTADKADYAMRQDEGDVAAEPDMTKNPVEDATGEIAEAESETEIETEMEDVAATEAEEEDEAFSGLDVDPEEIEDASFAARMSGDQLASDLFEAEGEIDDMPSVKEAKAESAVPAVPAVAAVAVGTPSSATLAEEPAQRAEVAPASVAAAPAAGAVAPDEAVDAASFTPAVAAVVSTGSEPGVDYIRLATPLPEPEPVQVAWSLHDNGPVFSVPLAAEQPRPVKSVDMVELTDSPEAAATGANPEIGVLPQGMTRDDAVRVLILPYHDRENPNNLIDATGGGEVVTTLFGTQLALDPGIQLLWDGSGQATHDRLVDRAEAIQMGRLVDADFVIRGQVVEFRRAQSVPSFYSAVISTAVLAAQIFFAEFSGVDVATEVYRVSDGECVMSRRDRAQQKYVVQAEKTVRRLAAGMASGVVKAVKAENPEAMDPLIDTLSPVTVLTNPR